MVRNITAIPGTFVRGVRRVRRGFEVAKGILRVPVSAASATAGVRARMALRASALLETMERAVFDHPGSPYRPLLDAAGYDLPRLRTLVTTLGVEPALERLRDDGVYVSVEEFKGRREVLRRGRVLHFEPSAFDNPLITSGYTASSGGTRSRGIATTISPENLRMGAEHLAVAISAYGLETLPIVVWLPGSHGASQWAVLALAAMRKAPSEWFTQLPVETSPTGRTVAQSAMRVWAGLHGTRLPVPLHVPLAEPSGIMRWISGLGGRGGGIFTTPSSALRLALTAARTGADLAGLVFITIGEPLTPVKRAGIQAVGARAFSSLGFTEFGRATYGCSVPASPDDTHIVEDAVAVIQRRRAVDRMGTEVDALLFTALRPDARKILLNMETGDYAAMNARRCGCPLEAVGWTRHLEGIRSFEKLNAEGRLFFGSELITLVEDVLPRRFGGDATDYQLIEQEDREGFTRLSVLVHPRLAVDEHVLLACVEDTFRSADRSSAQTWREAGTIQVRRAVPIMTGAGKVMALHHLRPGEHPTG